MPLIRPRKPYDHSEPKPSAASDSAVAPADPMADNTTAFTQLTGKAIANAHLYGAEHSIAQSTLDQAYDTLCKCLQEKGSMAVHVAEGQLFADNEAVEIRNPLMGTFAQAIAALGVSGITLEKGMTRAEFGEFAKALILGKARAPRTPGEAHEADTEAAPLLDASLFSHLKARKTVYRAVAEDEVVVRKDVAEQAAALGGFNGNQVRQIVAFLKGGSSTAAADSDENPLRNIETASSNAEQLADLIMKSAVIDSNDAQVEGGETLGNIVVGCLRRTFDTLNKAPGSQTRKGKKAIGKTLTILEKDILDRLRNTAREGHALAEQDISTAIADMTEELQASDLIEQYAKKSRAVSDDEARLARFIRKRGLAAIQDDALKNKLIEEGLSEEDWKKIVIRSGLTESRPPSPAASPAPMNEERSAESIADNADADSTHDVSTLISLLSDLTEAVAHTPPPATGETAANSGLMKVLEKIGSEVDAALAQTDEKVEALARLAEMLASDSLDTAEQNAAEPAPQAKSASEPPDKPKRPSPRYTVLQQRSVLRILGEITQEFSQPLSVVACALDMLSKMDAQAVALSGAPLLQLARENLDSMEDLIAKVVRVTGLPKGMTPDHAMLDAIGGLPTD